MKPLPIHFGTRFPGAPSQFTNMVFLGLLNGPITSLMRSDLGPQVYLAFNKHDNELGFLLRNRDIEDESNWQKGGVDVMFLPLEGDGLAKSDAGCNLFKDPNFPMMAEHARLCLDMLDTQEYAYTRKVFAENVIARLGDREIQQAAKRAHLLVALYTALLTTGSLPEIVEIPGLIAPRAVMDKIAEALPFGTEITTETMVAGLKFLIDLVEKADAQEASTSPA
jgi:hypothetical protein